jgi:VWFA-related protein
VTRPAFVTVALLLAWAAPAARQAPTFRAALEAVRLDVLVTERGRPIAGLGAADFDVRDSGVVQQVDLVSFQEVPLNVILAFDSSASVSGERLDHLRAAGRDLLGRLKADDRAALLTFSHVVSLREPPTTRLDRVRAALDRIQPSGSTALVDGTHAAMLLADADLGRSVVIVFSDGLDTASWLTPPAVTEVARRSEAVVYGVTVKGPGRPEFLEDLGNVTGGSVLEVESTRDLPAAFVRILDEFRQRYLLSYSPAGVPREGWHPLEVRVKQRRAIVRTRAGYYVGS